MLRDPIADIVSDSIVVYLKANTVKSTAKQKDFQSKIKMFRKKIQELTEKFKESDKLIENLKKTFVLSSEKVKDFKKKGYAERIYENADILNTIEKDISEVKRVQLSVDQNFGKNFDQSSVQDLQKTLKKIEIEREAKAQEAKDILQKLSKKEIPHVLTYDSSMMEKIRHHLEKNIRNLKIDSPDGKGIKSKNHVILENKNNLVIYSDVCNVDYSQKGKKGIIWTRYISIKNAPIKSVNTDEYGITDQTVDTFLAVSVVLAKPKMGEESLEDIPDFTLGHGTQNVFFINFINAKVRPSRIKLDEKSAYLLKKISDIDEALRKTSDRNNLDLFMDGEPEEEVILKTRAEIIDLARPFVSEYNRYKNRKLVNSLDVELEDLDEEYKQNKEDLIKQETETLSNYSEKFKNTEEYKAASKQSAILEKYINSKIKEIYKKLKIKTENEKNKIALDYKVVRKYEALKDSDRDVERPTFEQFDNYKKYKEILPLETELEELQQDLQKVQRSITAREINLINGVKNDFTLERSKLESDYNKTRNQTIKNHIPPKVELIFGKDRGIKIFWLDNGIRLLYPLDFPESMDQFLQSSIKGHNETIEKLRLKLKKLTDKSEQSISESKELDEEFVTYRNALYKSEVKKIRADLEKRNVNEKNIRKELNKFEKEFETEDVRNSQKNQFIREKEEKIQNKINEINKINKAIDEQKNSRAKKIQPSIENAETETTNGKNYFNTKKTKALPSERWEKKLLSEIYLIFGIPFQFDEGKKASKTRPSVSVKRSIIDYVPKDNPDNLEPVPMYEYIFKLVPPRKVEFDEEKTTSILPEPEYSLDTDAVEDTLKALEESGIPTKALSKKEREKLEREEAENKRLIENNSKIIQQNKQNKINREKFEKLGIAYTVNKKGDVVEDDPYEEDEILPETNESTEWAEEKPTVITRKAEEPVVKQKVKRQKKTQ